MERSLGFYQNVIGLQVISQTDRSAELSADGKRVLLVLEENQAPSFSRSGLSPAFTISQYFCLTGKNSASHWPG